MGAAEPGGGHRAARPPTSIVVVGQVDHGKSTLIARLLQETGAWPPGEAETLAAASARRGVELAWAFALDVLQAERDQGLSLDTTRVGLTAAGRDFLLIDVPGHPELLEKMVVGAADADGALLVVDAAEGLHETARRHAQLLRLLDVRQVVLAINKMDLVDFSEARFQAAAQAAERYLGELGITPRAAVPLSASQGDNLAAPSERMTWFRGPTLLAALDEFARTPLLQDLPLRFPIQDVYKVEGRRIFAGRVEAGVLRSGDHLLFSPANKRAKVRSIETWGADVAPVEAHAGQSIGITLDEELFLQRGEIASHARQAPYITNVFRARLFWLGEAPLEVDKTYKVRLTTREEPVSVQSIEHLVESDTLASVKRQSVGRDEVAEVVLRSRSLLALDPHQEVGRTGRCVLLEGDGIVAGGTISMEGYPDLRDTFGVKSKNLTAVEHRVPAENRYQRNGHRGAVLWLTGLSGAGKSTLAMEVELALFRRGYHVYVLDGDNVRSGLNANLGFSPEDRTENIRRVGEAAALFADAGFICITAFISPYCTDRERARAAAKGAFHEIHVAADLAVCEARDPKGLYRRARAGEIADFTGISAPYEPPPRPELAVDSGQQSIEVCVEQIVDYVMREVAIKT
jgi:bifunctional enzyme CysN/CysC